jgi:hypothetical protein
MHKHNLNVLKGEKGLFEEQATLSIYSRSEN